ncbi:MAG: right-handed parallel beta-helix repeat-containing protein [Acidobacteria bacterium]|nr:right-handed parallel beta-helix repeat-containing protein [Acidobacteriota bacterium]
MQRYRGTRFSRRSIPGVILALAAVACVPASGISSVQTYGCFETAGVDVAVSGMNFNETATLEVRKQGTGAWQRGHDFVRYDGNHLASSLFWLEPGTVYELRVTLSDPDGVTGTNPVTATVATRPEYTMPSPLRVVNVANQAELDAAVAGAQPGDEVRLAAGAYPGGIALFGVSGTLANPIVFTSQGETRPVIQGADAAISAEGSSHLVFDHLEVHNENGAGVYIRGSHHTVIRRCWIHDSQPGDYTANVVIQHSEEATPAYSGHHLILDNVISDETHDPVDENQGPGEPNVNTAGQSYFGIVLAYQPGPFITIRGNTIYGVVDGVHPTGDEGSGPVMGPDEPDLLQTWRDQNLDLYDNVIYDCKDDCIECDGHMVNGRVFRNRLGKCENALTAAPFYPGPLFVLRNRLHGFHQGCLKQNTGVDGLMRNVFFYHNTVMEKARTDDGYCLYRGEPATQEKFTYRNNVFYARGRVYNGDLYASGYHRLDTFDWNTLYSTRERDSVYAFKWVCEYGDPLNNTRYETLAAFRAATGQEAHGTWGDPLLDTTALPGYPAGSKLLNLRLLAGSPAADNAVPIHGINDVYAGSAPDAGAAEQGPLSGDVDGSGETDAADLAVIANVLVGNLPEGRAPCAWPERADYDDSGALAAADLVVLARTLAGL